MSHFKREDHEPVPPKGQEVCHKPLPAHEFALRYAHAGKQFGWSVYARK